MQYRPRYLVSAAIALVLSQAIASSNTTVRAAVSCDTLRAWARPFADRSPTLAALAAFDGGRRRAIFSAMAPAARVSLWREQLGALAERPDFTPSQRAAAAALRAAVVPDIYRKGSPAQERARARWKQREALFPDPAQRRAFLVLGAPAAAPAGRTDWCDCSWSYGQVECYPLVCGPANGCFGTPDGCGFTGMDPCVLKCQ